MSDNKPRGDYMRALPIQYVKENSILAEDLYNVQGRILIKKETLLTQKILKKIEANNVFTIYVKDVHNTIEVPRLVEQSLRINAILIIKSIFEAAKSQQSIFDLHNQLRNIADDILYEIRSYHKRPIEHIDIKNVDNYIYSSSLNTAVLSALIAWELGYASDLVKEIFLGAVYHDIGIALIDSNIINKKTALTLEEKMEIIMHPKKGYEYLKDKTFTSAYIKTIVLQHHEAFDGSGYPLRSKGNEINSIAQIVGVADIYDAMTSDRPYKRASKPKDAIEFILANSRSKFDENIVEAFNKKVTPFPPGALVELDDGRIATVDKINSDRPLEPQIRIITRTKDTYHYEAVNLSETHDITIKDITYETI